MKRMDTNISCPSCQSPMQTKVLGCDPCGVKIEGRFQANEFARLQGEDLHLLRIFIFCEGKIRDMEKALGVSYPTIKARIAALKETLELGTDNAADEKTQGTNLQDTGTSESAITGEQVMDILKKIEDGSLKVNEAVEKIKKDET